MPERPEPDLDHVREAMREHDERVEQGESEQAAPPEPEPEEPEDED